MAQAYPESVKAEARALWLAHRWSDERIARQVGVQRPDTIRHWRCDEHWGALAESVEHAVDARIAATTADQVRAMNDRHIRMAEVCEGAVAKLIRAKSAGGGTLPGAEIRACASALESLQRIERVAHGLDAPEADFPPAAPLPPRRVEFVVVDREEVLRRRAEQERLAAGESEPDAPEAPSAESA